MKKICLAAALLMSAFAFSPASAAPVQTAGTLVGNGGPVRLAEYHPHARRATRRHVRRHTAYVAGHRYKYAPHGWHRYSRRPGNWHTRGCILVGPVWFCP